MVGPALVAALTGHGVQAARPQRGELLQGLMDEGQVGIDAGGSHFADARKTGLTQNTLDGAVVHFELARNGARAPSLNVVVALDLFDQFRGHGHGGSLSGLPNVGGDEYDSAETRFAQTDHSCSDRNSTAQALVHRIGVTSHQEVVKQAVPQVGNPDASLSLLGALGSDPGAQRGHDDRDGCTGTADRHRPCNGHALVRRTQGYSSGCRGRSGCK